MRTSRRLMALLTVLALAALPAAAAAAPAAPAASTASTVSPGGADGGVADLHAIPFASGTVDPARDLAAEDPAGGDLVLVQWSRYGDSDAVHRIAATGVRLVQPLAPVSYLVWADAAQTRAVRDLPGVRFAGVLPPDVRVAPSVTEATTHLRVTFVGDREVAGLPVAASPRTFTDVGGAVAVVPGGLDEAAAFSRMPRVYSVADAGGPRELRDEQSSQIIAQGTDGDAHAEPGYRDFLADVGADGSGVTVSMVDGGTDHNHPDLSGQVASCYDYTTPLGVLCPTGNTDDVIGHGTFVLGVILGTGTTSFTDADGFALGLGVAPGAKAVSQNAINAAAIPADLAGVGPFADGYTPVYTQAVRDGAIVSNNSWGPSGSPQGYDAATREFDQIVRDADPETEGDQPIALSWSIMNGSGGESTQGSPDEAKNLIAVGGSGARGSRTADDLCTCTAHGPNLDGRRLVDIVAPGQNVVSTRASQGLVCGTAAGGTMPSPPSPFHGPCTGTSFASPHVTGAYAVFVDWFRANVAEDEAATPSPALVKAAMINTADDLAQRGGLDADGEPLTPIPNDQQGWGRLNLGSLIRTWEAGVVVVDQERAFTASGESFEVRVAPLDPDRPLRATLAWTDAPGPGTGGEVQGWVNDLDLVVEDPAGRTWLGNVFADGASAPGGEADERNNVENVFLASAGDGTYTIRVDASNIIGKASPHADSPTWQDFALVIGNAEVVQGVGAAAASATGLDRAAGRASGLAGSAR
jgi:serine protease AprX